MLHFVSVKMNADDNPESKKPEFSYRNRIRTSALIFLAVILSMMQPSTVENQVDWLLAILPVLAIALLFMPILRGTILERIIALFFFILFVFAEFFGASELLGHYLGINIYL
ncbi:MAG TPA: hypothetical protein VHG71_09520 [Verrucomicrobiae bacterium]|nr:hypothetical protein [Verrucomicrobiae bacterium]